jgi:hypothetical protein
MKRTPFAAVVAALMAPACGENNPLSGGNRLKTVSGIWSDVPKMDGLSPSHLEMPIFVKLLMRTALNVVLSRGGQDWIVFTTAKPRDDLKSLYTSERMATAGINPTNRLGGVFPADPRIGGTWT